MITDQVNDILSAGDIDKNILCHEFMLVLMMLKVE